MKHWNYFNVAGVTFPNDAGLKDEYGQDMSRLDFVSKYTSGKSKFKLERDRYNPYSENAIKVKQVFASGGEIVLGFVPDSEKNALASELAPLMDSGKQIEVRFCQKFICHKTGAVKGLQLRYRV